MHERHKTLRVAALSAPCIDMAAGGKRPRRLDMCRLQVLTTPKLANGCGCSTLQMCEEA